MIRNKKIITQKMLSEIKEDCNSKNKSVVLTVGCFDLLHVGHARFLAEARASGDILAVGVASNKSRKKLKGEGHPVLDEKIRAEMLSYLRSVDYTLVVDEDNVSEELVSLKPRVFYTAKDDWKDGIRKREEARIVKDYGGKIIKVQKEEPYLSSSEMIKKVADLKIKQILRTFFDEIKIGINNHNGREPMGSAEDFLSFKKQVPKDLISLLFKGRIVHILSLPKLGEEIRSDKKSIVFVSGSYDLLHVGHARYLEKAKEQGDVLVVGIPSNVALRKLKGPGRPMVDENARSELLCYLDSVDYVVIFGDETVRKCLELLKPDVFFTIREEWNKGYKRSPEHQIMKSFRGKVIAVPRQSPYLSASAIIDRVAGVRVKMLFKDALKAADRLEAIAERAWEVYE